MTTCPVCGHPVGDRLWAPRNGVAPCVADRFDELAREPLILDQPPPQRPTQKRSQS